MIVGNDIAKYTDLTVLIAVDAKTGICMEMARFKCSTPNVKLSTLKFDFDSDGQLSMLAGSAH